MGFGRQFYKGGDAVNIPGHVIYYVIKYECSISEFKGS